MSLHARGIGDVPEETSEVAHSIFPKGNMYLTLRDQLGHLYQDEDFADLFSEKGQPAESPWRLAWVTVLQFMENLTDRQAADAVRSRIDWKYLLGLPLRDTGFHYSVLCEFRQRLVEGGAGDRLLNPLLTVCRESGWLKERGKQRTDSTHILARVRSLNRLELVGTTLQHALNRLAQEAPEWLKQQVNEEWYDRYGQRVEQYRLPKSEKERHTLMNQVGQDGMYLLNQLFAGDEVPTGLWRLPEIQLLRQIWVQQYYQVDGQTVFRPTENMPPAALRCYSPHDPDARYATKGNLHWVGYKVHFTETCDEHAPHLVIHVATVPSTEHDVRSTPRIHRDLAVQQLLPKEHLLDSAYTDAALRLSSQQDYEVELISPAQDHHSWQKQTPDAFAADAFTVNPTDLTMICPAGHTSHRATAAQDKAGFPILKFLFRLSHCSACPLKPRCTRRPQRIVAIRDLTHWQVLQAARHYQTTEDFKERYKARAGIEGTLSQAVGAFELRAARYIGLKKTHLQNLASATALNLNRLFHWFAQRPLAKTRLMPFAQLALAP